MTVSQVFLRRRSASRNGPVSARESDTAARVHAALAKLGPLARAVLWGTYGLGYTPFFGTENEAEFARFLGMPRLTDLAAHRAKAKASFRAVYR